MKQRFITARFTFVICVALTASVSAQNLLDDGTFDLADSGTQTSNSAWSLNVNFPDGTDPAARFQTGFGNAENNSTQSPGEGAGVWFRSFEGNQGGSGEPLANADITQTVVAPSDGDYILDFRAAIEGVMGFGPNGSFTVSLSSDGTGGTDMIDLLTAGIPSGNIGGAASPNLGGTPLSLTLLGVTAGDNLTVSGAMVDGMDTGMNPQSGFLDQFNLRLVPEPSGISLMLLAALGFASLKRRN